MSEKTEKNTASAKLNGFLEKNRKPVIISFIVVLVLVLGFIATAFVTSRYCILLSVLVLSSILYLELWINRIYSTKGIPGEHQSRY